MPLGRKVGLHPSDIVLNGNPTPRPQKGGRAPNFQPMSIVPKWLDGSKMPLGTKVGLDPSDIVLDRDPAPPPKRGTAPQFLAHVYCGQTVDHLSYC